MSAAAVATDISAKDFLVHLAESNGGVLLPRIVVEAARPFDSPIHDRFTWDDTEAAEKYRIYEAGRLIRVAVETMAVSGKTVTARVFVSLPSDREEGGGYRLTISALSDKQQRHEMLASALRELRSFEQKYSTLRELASVMKPINRFLKSQKEQMSRLT